MKKYTSEDLQKANSWTFQQARLLIKRSTNNQIVKLQTGYGPSGLPHMGTFGEVARTSMVAQSYELLTGKKTQIIVFSDDMDGMRKIPPNVKNQELLNNYLEHPLSKVPDPDGKYPSFAHHNNARLQNFLDKFNFSYKFISATELYEKGFFNEVMKLVLKNNDAIKKLILPTLGEERRNSYSPILPICQQSGKVLYVPLTNYNLEDGTISFTNEGKEVTQSFLNGMAKFQWKVDWAARWHALDIDYEMSGEDLTESVKLSSKIIKILGKKAPAGFNYQLFLDENGKKISKTKGNGIGVEQWLHFANSDSLAFYMFKNPIAAKKLYFDVIPKSVDEYYQHARASLKQTGKAYLDNPAVQVNHYKEITLIPPISFALLLTLVGSFGEVDEATLVKVIQRYCGQTSKDQITVCQQLIIFAKNYFQAMILPTRNFYQPTTEEKLHLKLLLDTLNNSQDINNDQATDQEIEKHYQQIIFDIGKKCGFEDIKVWFNLLYRTLFGNEEGPRMGSFIALIGLKEFSLMLSNVLN